MAVTEIQWQRFLSPIFMQSKVQQLWMDYDEEADVLYMTFKRPSRADDSATTNDGVILRYEGSELVGITIFNANQSLICLTRFAKLLPSVTHSHGWVAKECSVKKEPVLKTIKPASFVRLW